jgi:holliday junction DNA helicase RuvA
MLPRRSPPVMPHNVAEEMIAFLRGKLLEKHPNQIIVDTSGVGYDVVIPISTFSALPDAGAEVALRIHTHVREDALALFGFLTDEEKALFERLISVSGIGPTLAIKILSGLATATIIDAIRGGHVEQLVRIPGVGRKTAERMVLELKDKLEGLGSGSAPPGVSPRTEPVLSDIEQDVLSALVNLGCNRASAEAAVRKAKTAAPASAFEPMFRKALELVR